MYSRKILLETYKFVQTSLKVNSVLERESSQTISTSILSNNFRNIKSVLFLEGFHSSKAIKTRTNQFIFTKPEKIYYERVNIYFVHFEKYIDFFVIYFYAAPTTIFCFRQVSARLSKCIRRFHV